VIEALAEAAGRPVSRETFDRLCTYVELLKTASQHQNLISAATIDDLWDRHILDSAQLVKFEPRDGASWIDIGAGAGLPGIVIACLVTGPVTLAEPRRLRANFLAEVVGALGLRATVQPVKAQRVEGKFDIITGRAVAPLSDFLKMCEHLSTKNSIWALPRGRSASSELAEAQRTWQGVFHVEPSVTDPDSRIVVGTKVRARDR
jgi:16S rRNA (guanine527-N7)-methyltransferase